MQIDLTDQRKHLDPEQYSLRRLAAAIVYWAAADWKRLQEEQIEHFRIPSNIDGFVVNKQELSEFFESDWFDTLTNVVDMSAERILEKLGISGNQHNG